MAIGLTFPRPASGGSTPMPVPFAKGLPVIQKVTVTCRAMLVVGITGSVSSTAPFAAAGGMGGVCLHVNKIVAGVTLVASIFDDIGVLPLAGSAGSAVRSVGPLFRGRVSRPGGRILAVML